MKKCLNDYDLRVKKTPKKCDNNKCHGANTNLSRLIGENIK